jgi:hypothetical protein
MPKNSALCSIAPSRDSNRITPRIRIYMQGVQFDQNNPTRGRKSRETVPLIAYHESELKGVVFFLSLPRYWPIIFKFLLLQSRHRKCNRGFRTQTLKGPWHEIFDLCFFHQTTSSAWSLVHIREDNQQRWLHSGERHSGVIDTKKKLWVYCNNHGYDR